MNWIEHTPVKFTDRIKLRRAASTLHGKVWLDGKKQQALDETTESWSDIRWKFSWWGHAQWGYTVSILFDVQDCPGFI